jgi:hypothetical protein
MEPYPRYKADPRVKEVVDRCLKIGLGNFYKPYSNRPSLYKFSTLERDLCRPGKLPLKEKIKLGLLVNKGKKSMKRN